IHKGRIQVLNQIYFAAGKADIKPSAFPIADAIAATLNGNPQISLVEVPGHVAAGEKDRVAASRAGAVVTALVARGVDRSRLVARAYGRTKPVCTKKSEDCLARNRRVEFVILNRPDAAPRVSEAAPPPPKPAE